MKYTEYAALCEELYEGKKSKEQFLQVLVASGIDRVEAEKIHAANTDGISDVIQLRVDENENIIGIKSGDKK